MPKWQGRWKGGRYYLDDLGRQVFFIERRRRSIRLRTHDPELALGELARFLDDPVAYCRPAPEPTGPAAPVHITIERVKLYLEHIHKAVEDHRKARRAYLLDWANWRDDHGRPLDLRNVDRATLRVALGEFGGGHAARVETLNAFARFLIREAELDRWNPLVNTRAPRESRAERVAYDVAKLDHAFARLDKAAELYQQNPTASGAHSRAVRDAFVLRAATGMHHTEIEQLSRCKTYDGPLPDKGVGIRQLPDGGEIAGVIQFRQKTKPRHRVSVPSRVLVAALRLREGVPDRITMWYALGELGIVPSNLRHTWITLAGEAGRTVHYRTRGATLDEIQQAAGHRIGSKVTLSNYDKLQIPPMIVIPLGFIAGHPIGSGDPSQGP
jgi:hypothetical protein